MAARKGKIAKWFDDLPPGAQIGIMAGGAVVLFFGGRSIIRALKSGAEQAQLKADQLVLQQAGQTPSYQDSQYYDMANKMYYGMQSDWYNPFDWGTDESAIEEVFNLLKNDLDFIKLKQAFGMRDGYTMQEWIVGDFSSSGRAGLNSILAQKGITYRV